MNLLLGRFNFNRNLRTTIHPWQICPLRQKSSAVPRGGGGGFFNGRAWIHALITQADSSKSTAPPRRVGKPKMEIEFGPPTEEFLDQQKGKSEPSNKVLRRPKATSTCLSACQLLGMVALQFSPAISRDGCVPGITPRRISIPCRRFRQMENYPGGDLLSTRLCIYTHP
ncbi:hypothetical protein CPSG_07970 [Coccidioides posadasii str. Silveira]|uniref:Uncharacterized protein n=1 Tax=Coccidioides posadasii (strain RMSCC 757 / Silveira) TaxID=443226 RepID=E9DD08_COCPS|nr:hypothetical protein CPSG_07970 [Coccidioides posadasii str. Silveira]